MAACNFNRFSAIGGPMPAYKEPSAWEKSCPYGIQAPYFPPVRFTDDSIITVMVRPEEAYEDEKAELKKIHGHRFGQFLHKLKGINATNPQFKCVFMPRRDYVKYFARDRYGNYIGTERERRWSEEELDDSFGTYHRQHPRKWVLRNENDQEFMEEASEET